jgi:hypothetical protein
MERCRFKSSGYHPHRWGSLRPVMYGSGRGEHEHCSSPELFGLAVPAERDELRLAHLVGIATQGVKLTDPGGGDPGRQQTVDPDPGWAELVGERLDHAREAWRGGDVAGTSRPPRLRDVGKVFSYGAISRRPVALVVRDDLIYGAIGDEGFWIVNWLQTAPRGQIEATYREVVAPVDDGELSATVDSTYRLDQYRDALARAQQYWRPGKVVFAFGDADSRS